MIPRFLLGLLVCSLGLRAATGDILSVTIETNGWQALVEVEGLNTNGTYSIGVSSAATYLQLTAPKLTIHATTPGYDTAGNSKTWGRTEYGTKAVRQTYPHQAFAAESVSGGNVTLRIALTDYIYSGDTGITADVAASLYTQGGTPNNAAAGVSVVNNSTMTYHKPVANWSRVPLQVFSGPTHTVALVAFDRDAIWNQPAQCVEFWASDGTNTTASVFTSTATTNTVYGDPYPSIEFQATLNIAGLNPGAVSSLHAKIYPRFGQSSHILNSATHGFTFPSYEFAPHTFISDPSGSYGQSVAVVASGGNDSTGVVVSSGAFNSASPPSAFATIAGAVNAVQATNNVLYSRNEPGNGIIYLRTGSWAFAGGTVTVNTPATWVTLKAFPGESPIITSSSGTKNISTFTKLDGIKISSTSTATFDVMDYLWLHGCTFTNITDTRLIDTVGNVYVTGCNIWAIPQGLGPQNVTTDDTKFRLIRGNLFDLDGEGIWPSTVLGNRRMAGSTGATRTSVGFFGTIAAGVETPTYPIIAFNGFWGEAASTGSDVVSLFPSTASYRNTNGFAVVQNLIEFIDGDVNAPRCMSIASSAQGTGDTNDTPYAIIWHNTAVGQRCNLLENAGGTNSGGWFEANRKWPSFVNNMMEQPATKSDLHYTPDTSSTRVGGFAFQHGVGSNGNTDLDPTGMDNGGWFWDFPGLNSYWTSNSANPSIFGWSKFVDRKASNSDGTDTAGFGDYHLTAASPLIKDMSSSGLIGHRAVLPWTLDGDPRPAANAPPGAFGYRGTNYFVSLSGSDANSGLMGSPKLTMQAGFNLLSTSGGDTLTISNGVYTVASSRTINNGGPYRNVIQAESRGGVTNKWGGWVCYGSNITVDGIAFEFITNNGRIDLSGIVLETNTHGFYGLNNSFRNFTNSLPNNNYAGYYMLMGDYGAGTNRPHHPWWYYPVNCVFSNNVNETIWSGHCYFIMGSNNLVVNNIIRNQANGDAFYLHGVSNVVRGNYVTNVYLTGYGQGMFGSTITTNFVVPAVGANVTVGVDASAWMTVGLTLITRQQVAHFEVISQPTATTVELEFLGTGGDVSPGTTITAGRGIGLSGGMHPDLFQTFGQSGEANGPWVDAWGMVIERNQFWDCLIALAQLENRDTATPSIYAGEWEDVRLGDWLFRNNVFVRCGSAEGSISSIDLPTRWINNTFLACGTNALSSGEVLGFNFFSETNQLKGAATNTFVINNAFVGCGRSTNGGWFQYEILPGFDSNNIAFTAFSNHVAHWNGSAWSAKNPNELTQGSYPPPGGQSYVVWPAPDINPGTDPLLYGWDLQSHANHAKPLVGSALIDAGTNSASYLSDDFERLPRAGKGAGVDLGAWEFDPDLQVHLDFQRDFVGDGEIADSTGYGHTALNMVSTNWITAEVDSVRGRVGVWTSTWTNGISEDVSAYAAITNLTGIEFITNGTVAVWVKWATNGVGGWTTQGTERWDAILECGYNTQFAGNSAEATNSWVLQYGSPNLSETPVGPVFKHYTTGDNNSTNGILARWTQPRDENEWHHIAVTWSADTGAFVAYEDGNQHSASPFSAPYLRVSGQSSPWLAVGTQTHDGTPQWGDDAYPNFGFLKGRISDLRIYDRVLTAEELSIIAGGGGEVLLTTAEDDPGGGTDAPARVQKLRVLLGPTL